MINSAARSDSVGCIKGMLLNVLFYSITDAEMRNLNYCIFTDMGTVTLIFAVGFPAKYTPSFTLFVVADLIAEGITFPLYPITYSPFSRYFR